VAIRGLASIIVNGIPDETRDRKGLLVLSCSDKISAKIQTALFDRSENVTWTVIRRNPSSDETPHESTIYSMRVNSLAQRSRLVHDLRKERFDVVAVAWTGERSYAPLKVLGLLTNFGSLLALKEDGFSFYVVRSNLRQFASHVWLRWRTREKRWGSALYRVGSVLLIPLGLIVLFAQVLRYTLVKMFITSPYHSNEKSVQQR